MAKSTEIFPGPFTRHLPWHTIPLTPLAVLVMEWPLSNTLPPFSTVTTGRPVLQPDRSDCSTPVSPAGTTWQGIVISTPYAGPTRSGSRASSTGPRVSLSSTSTCASLDFSLMGDGAQDGGG